MRKLIAMLAATAASLFAVTFAGMAQAAAAGNGFDGAIHTTDVTGVPVNLNQYDAKQDVYLEGGPGPNAPPGASALPDGTYTFQVTDPSGKTLLSTDQIACRQFTIVNAQITSVAASDGCAHVTGTDNEQGGLTVQLFPFNDTPNNGGVYKVWVTLTSNLDCGSPRAKFCFIPRYSKTDNFKVNNTVPVEIDTTFSKPGVDGYIDGLAVTWTDTLGASNVKYSEYDPNILAFHEAHVEAAEPGTHQITITDQPGCTIATVLAPDGRTYTPVNGSVTLNVKVANRVDQEATYFVRVTCAAD